MDNFKYFIKHNLITSKGGLYSKRLHKDWGQFESLRPQNNLIKFLYDYYYNIKETPKCNCGFDKKFFNFKRGYDKCIRNSKCRNKINKTKEKLTYSDFIYIEDLNFLNNKNDFYNIALKYKGYLNTKYTFIATIKKILRYCSEEETLLNLENYIKAIHIDKTIKRKDSASLKAIKLMYGENKADNIYNNRVKGYASNGLDFYLNKYNNEEIANNKYKLRLLKTTNSYEAFLYRNNYDKEKI